MNKKQLRNNHIREQQRKSVRSAISSNIVSYLQGQGMTLKNIGILIGLKESFISRVRNRQRSFTLEHLSKLEKALGKPLPIILIKAMPVESAPEELRTLYVASRDLLNTLGDLEEETTGNCHDTLD